MYRGPEGFARWMSIWMNVFLNIVLNVAAPLAVESATGAVGLLTFASFLQGFVMGTFIGLACADLIPAFKWATALSDKLHLKKVASHFVSSAVLALVFTTVLLFIISFINNIATGGMGAVFGFFILIYPSVLLYAYIAMLVILPVAQKLASLFSGFDPRAVSRSIDATRAEKV